MYLLTILIVLGLLQLWGSGKPLQKDQWFSDFCLRVQAVISLPALKLLLSVGVPLLLVVLLESLFTTLWFGLLTVALYVLVLLYSLGRGDFTETLRDYLSRWNHGNFESAYEEAMRIGDFQQNDGISDHVSLHEHVRAEVFYVGYERWFAVVFWFLLLGPVGALGYRLSYLCGRNDALGAQSQQLALRCVHYLDWLPARLLAFSFSLTGNFMHGFAGWRENLWDNQPIPELLDHCGLAALSGIHEKRTPPVDEEHFIEFAQHEIHAVQALLSRSVICWLILIAVLEMLS